MKKLPEPNPESVKVINIFGVVKIGDRSRSSERSNQQIGDVRKKTWLQSIVAWKIVPKFLRK